MRYQDFVQGQQSLKTDITMILEYVASTARHENIFGIVDKKISPSLFLFLLNLNRRRTSKIDRRNKILQKTDLNQSRNDIVTGTSVNC